MERADSVLVQGLLEGPLGPEARRFLRQELGRPGFSGAQKARLRILLSDQPLVKPATSHRPAMVPIPAGEFRMGSDEYVEEGPIHRVTITRPFLLAETPVTCAQYWEVMASSPSAEGPEVGGRPVERVNWRNTIDYCNRLSRREGVPPCYIVKDQAVEWIKGSSGYRLPTEAEWEYAARAGQQTRYAGSDDPKVVAWYDGNSSRSHPVKRKAANAWGLYDMSGNVWEWVWDWYGRYPDLHEEDPRGPPSGFSRVVRGGSWASIVGGTRVARRLGAMPENSDPGRGLHVARSYP